MTITEVVRNPRSERDYAWVVQELEHVIGLLERGLPVHKAAPILRALIEVAWKAGGVERWEQTLTDLRATIDGI